MDLGIWGSFRCARWSWDCKDFGTLDTGWPRNALLDGNGKQELSGGHSRSRRLKGNLPRLWAK